MRKFVKPASRRSRPSASPAPASRRSRARPMPRSGRTRVERHRRWREKHQDILVTFTDPVRRSRSVTERETRSAAKRLIKSAPDFGVVVRSGPDLRSDFPRGHPHITGIEHVDPVIVTVAISCSMAQAVDLLEHEMPFKMFVTPIPSERCNVW